jgi:ribonuclease E
VHTLEAAKALLAAQVAAFPPQIDEPWDEEEPFDIETESEVETEETEGLTEEAAAGEEAGGETDAEGHKRKRRRRRRGRPGEPREGAPARDSTDAPRMAPDQVAVAGLADGAEGDEDESEEQPGAAHADQTADGERRPRRRGRRGGRRRRGGPEDGLVGSIADELGPTSAPEVSSAVADFDGYSAERAPLDVQPAVQPEPVAPPPEPQAAAYVQPVPAQPEPARASSEADTAQEAERAAARRRSTVREKVSFLPTAQPEAPAPVAHSQPEPPASAPAESAAETTIDTQPRKAGWWSRRFGNSE